MTSEVGSLSNSGAASRRQRRAVTPTTRPRAGVANNTPGTYEAENVRILNLFRPRQPLTFNCRLPDQMSVILAGWNDGSILRAAIQLSFRRADSYLG
jgi:hypothetical protein